MPSPVDVLRQCGDAFAAGDAEALGRLFAEPCVCDVPLVGEALTTPEAVTRAAARARAALEDVELHLEHVGVDDSAGLAECSLRARLASGRTIELGLFAAVELADGRIERLTAYLDRRELGA